MKAPEAVELLKTKQTVHNVNSGETITAKESDDGMRVTCTNADGVQQIMNLSRMAQLYRGHTFGKGAMPKAQTPAKVETPAA